MKVILVCVCVYVVLACLYICMSVFALSERIVEKVSSTGISMFATRNFQCIEVKKRHLAQGVTLDTLLLLMLERRVLRSWIENYKFAIVFARKL